VRKWELVELSLKQDVCQWAQQRRAQNPRAGSRTLAAELYRLTGRQVSHTTLLRWCPNLPLEGSEPHDQSG
jgi:hypothetical protein